MCFLGHSCFLIVGRYIRVNINQHNKAVVVVVVVVVVFSISRLNVTSFIKRGRAKRPDTGPRIV